MWFWIALIAALSGSVENYLNKKALHKVRPILMSWSAFALALPILVIFVILHGFSRINILFFVGTFGSSVVYVGAKVMKNNSFKNAELSKIVPLTSFGSFFTYILSLFFLSEHISAFGVFGLFLIMIATYMLNIEKAKEHLFEPIKVLLKDKDSVIYMFAMILSSISAVFDKTGIINSFPANAAMALLAENIFMASILTVLLMKEKGWRKDLKNNFVSLTNYSIVYNFTSLLVFIGFSDGPVALVQGVKRLELLFTLILGYFFLNDKPPKHAWIATILMIIGIVFIKIG
jgi:uncharacterized membrane protein